MKDLLHRPLGVDALAAHDLGGARRKHRIVEHEELRVEDRIRAFNALDLDDHEIAHDEVDAVFADEATVIEGWNPHLMVVP